MFLNNAGVEREVVSIYNTFTYSGNNYLSPGSYFCYGDNITEENNSIPASVTKVGSDSHTEIVISHPIFSGLNLLAWHKLDEATDDFMDSSGNGVTAKRIGAIESISGRRGGGATIKKSSTIDGNIIFTLPHNLTSYTISFWIRPYQNNWVTTYQKSFDILGGYVDYGAIPGSWYVSLAHDHVYIDKPYPAFQTYDHYDNNGWPFAGRICFGTYGGAVYTSRNYWKQGLWYHLTFSFSLFNGFGF
jgi:hypothetical protein